MLHEPSSREERGATFGEDAATWAIRAAVVPFLFLGIVAWTFVFSLTWALRTSRALRGRPAGWKSPERPAGLPTLPRNP